ncbi:hypothetical protein BKA62DRAFT_750406 [Auriculariales sp. MPI-PUGE-AT-0066]|nr:hypothetical protein BKA62DRAFT_750406 [Auriculariales sp. MPI-PUGE-AT-0066]
MVVPQRPPEQVPSPAAAFERLLARSAKGNALWRPATQTGSGSVGDCGFFRDGSFIKLFSAFGPPMGLPMLQLDNGDVQRQNVPNSTVIQSSTRSKVVLARGVPVGPPPHTCTGTFELAADEEAVAFLAFGGHSRSIDSGPAKKLALWLIVLLHETTKAGAWLGGVAYPTGAVAGSFTLDSKGARVAVRKPRDPTAQKHPASVRFEFTYGRNDGATPSCCVLAKPVIARRGAPVPTTMSSRSRSSTWSSDIGPRSQRTSATSLSSAGKASTWSKGSGGSVVSVPTGRRLSVRALAEWNKLHPTTPMTEEHLEIRSPVPLETIPPSPVEDEFVDNDTAQELPQPDTADVPEHLEPEPKSPEELSLLERLLDNILREYPGIEMAVGDWNSIAEYEDRCGRLPPPELVVSFKALQKWVTKDGAHAVYLNHIPSQSTSLGFIDLRAYTTTIRAPPALLTPDVVTLALPPVNRPPLLPPISSSWQHPPPGTSPNPSSSLSSSTLLTPIPPSAGSARHSSASTGKVRLGLGVAPTTSTAVRTPGRKPSSDNMSMNYSRRPSVSCSSQGTPPSSSGFSTPNSAYSSTMSSMVGLPLGNGAGRRLRAGSVLAAMSVPAAPRRTGSVPDLRG